MLQGQVRVIGAANARVELAPLPRDTWIGLPVFHPFEQRGTICSWHTYDVVVVTHVAMDADFGESLGSMRVGFRGACGDGGWSLTYSPENLWVPKVLADRLATPVAGGT